MLFYPSELSSLGESISVQYDDLWWHMRVHQLIKKLLIFLVERLLSLEKPVVFLYTAIVVLCQRCADEKVVFLDLT